MIHLSLPIFLAFPPCHQLSCLSKLLSSLLLFSPSPLFAQWLPCLFLPKWLSIDLLSLQILESKPRSNEWKPMLLSLYLITWTALQPKVVVLWAVGLQTMHLAFCSATCPINTLSTAIAAAGNSSLSVELFLWNRWSPMHTHSHSTPPKTSRINLPVSTWLGSTPVIVRYWWI